MDTNRLTLERKQTRANIVGKRTGGRSAPTTVNSSVRTREYLTTAEIERLMAAARKSSRYGHRDATMILIGRAPAPTDRGIDTRLSLRGISFRRD